MGKVCEFSTIPDKLKNPWREPDERFKVASMRNMDIDKTIVRVADMKNMTFVSGLVTDCTTVEAVTNELKQMLLDRDRGLLETETEGAHA